MQLKYQTIHVAVTMARSFAYIRTKFKTTIEIGWLII